MDDFLKSIGVDVLKKLAENAYTDKKREEEFISIFVRLGEFIGDFEMDKTSKDGGLKDIVSSSNMRSIAKRILENRGESIETELKQSLLDPGITDERVRLLERAFIETAIPEIKKRYPEVYSTYKLEKNEQSIQKLYDEEKRLNTRIGELDIRIANLESEGVVIDAVSLRKKLGCISDKYLRMDRYKEEKLIGREWLYDEFKKQILKGKKILVLLGDPGFGKTMFVAHSEENLPVEASFSFDCTSEEYKKVDRCIAEIVCQLVENNQEFSKQIFSLYQNDKEYDCGIEIDRFRRLIVEPLKNVCNKADILIAIDGLDEAEYPEKLVKCLAEYESILPPNIHFLVTSRADEKIVAEIESINSLYVFNLCSIRRGDFQKKINGDSCKYFASRLERRLREEGYSKKERGAFYDRMAKKSRSVFAYNVKICDSIIDDIKNAQEKKIDIAKYRLPNGMENLFLSTMRRIKFEKHRELQVLGYEAFWRKPLGMIIASPTAMFNDTLCGLMKWKRNDFSDFIRPLSTLFSIHEVRLLGETKTGIIEVFHLSFAEWLCDEKLAGKFFTSKEDGRTSLAEACFELYQSMRGYINENYNNPLNEKENYYSNPKVVYLSYNLLWLLREEHMEKEYLEVKNDKAFIVTMWNICATGTNESTRMDDLIRGLQELRMLLRESDNELFHWIYVESLFYLLSINGYQENKELINECELEWEREIANASNPVELSYVWIKRIIILADAYQKKNEMEKSEKTVREAIGLFEKKKDAGSSINNRTLRELYDYISRFNHEENETIK